MDELIHRLCRVTALLTALASCVALVSASQPLPLDLGSSGSHNDGLGLFSLHGSLLGPSPEAPAQHSSRWRCEPREMMLVNGDQVQLVGSTEVFSLHYVLDQCCSGFLSKKEPGFLTPRLVQRFKMCLGLFDMEAQKLNSVNQEVSLPFDEIKLDLNSSLESESSSATLNSTSTLVEDIREILKQFVPFIMNNFSNSISDEQPAVPEIENNQEANSLRFLDILKSKMSKARPRRSIGSGKQETRLTARNDAEVSLTDMVRENSQLTERSDAKVSSADMVREILNWLAPSNPNPSPYRAERRLDLDEDEQEDGRYEECELVRNSTECGLAPIKRKVRVKRIVNGYRSREHEWPWVVSIYTIPEPTFWFIFFKSLSCGGVLLTQRVVLSCAHCFHSVRYTMSPNKIKVVAGTNSYFDEPSTMKVQRLLLHPGFDPLTFQHDLSLLLLERPLEFQVNIQPACLPPPTQADFMGRLGTVLGWGYTSTTGPSSHWLHDTDVRILSGKECSSMYAKTDVAFELPEGSFCAGYQDGHTDACEGDSGGPLLVEDDCGIWQVAGLVSNGYSCAQPNQPGIYTDVIFHRSWITDNTARLEKEADQENIVREEIKSTSSRKNATVEKEQTITHSNGMQKNLITIRKSFPG